MEATNSHQVCRTVKYIFLSCTPFSENSPELNEIDQLLLCILTLSAGAYLGNILGGMSLVGNDLYFTLCILIITAGAYLGNILGGMSLVGNDLYFAHHGVLPICQKGVDRYGPLYFGLAISMMSLVLNSRHRYFQPLRTGSISYIDPVIILNFAPRCENLFNKTFRRMANISHSREPSNSHQVGLQNKFCFHVDRSSGLFYENSTELDEVGSDRGRSIDYWSSPI